MIVGAGMLYVVMREVGRMAPPCPPAADNTTQATTDHGGPNEPQSGSERTPKPNKYEDFVDNTFILAHPGDGWKLMTDVQARGIDPRAAAGFWGPDGCHGLVLSAERPSEELDTYTASAIESMGLAQQQTLFNDNIRYCSQEANRYQVKGKRDGKWLRTQVTIVFYEQRAFHVVVTSSGDFASSRHCFDRFTTLFDLRVP